MRDERVLDLENYDQFKSVIGEDKKRFDDVSFITHDMTTKDVIHY